MTLKEMQLAVNKVGWSVDTWSPGDGITRYGFFDKVDQDYVGDSKLYTALGKKEAIAFLTGLILGASLKTS